jgi:hypothetical protein
VGWTLPKLIFTTAVALRASGKCGINCQSKVEWQTLRSMLKRKQNRQSNQYQFTLNWPRLYHCSNFLCFEHVDTDDLNTGTLQQRTEYLRSFIFAGSDQVSAPPAAIEGSYVNIQSRRYRTR